MLLRVVRILAAFTPEASALTVTAIARRAALPQATASRLVAEMIGHGLLAREPGGRVRIGVRLWELAQRAAPTLRLREAAMPFMQDLHNVIGHHVQLGVLDGDEVLFLERLSAPEGVVNITRIAGRLPLLASSSGLVLLAHADHELQERILTAPLRSYTTNTVTSPRRLRALPADVRRQQFALCAGHVDLSGCGPGGQGPGAAADLPYPDRPSTASPISAGRHTASTSHTTHATVCTAVLSGARI